MNQVEPVFCHSPETLRLVQVVRLLDETLRQARPETQESLRERMRELVSRGRSIAGESLTS